MGDDVMRIGSGFDVHRFARDRRLVLGGVEISHPLGLEGHSDADVVLHAIVDALLGALALGDIGAHFPNSDPAYRNVDSAFMLKQVVEQISERGYTVGNVDVTVIAERPKLQPYIGQMRETIASVLACSVDQVSVKATTMERMGSIGREEGIAAQAVALLMPDDRPLG